MKNKINSYGLCVIKGKNNIPLFCIQVNHEIHSCFMVFSNNNLCNNFINQIKNELYELSYNPNFHFSKKLINEYINADYLFCNISNKSIYIKY